MSEVKLFTDGSVHPQLKVGFGACLILPDNDEIINFDSMVQTKKFENTSSTKLELQSFLWAISLIPKEETKITVYTDSQNIVGLLGRRKRFEENAYVTKKGTLIANHELYKAFYLIMDQLECEIVKVKGHKTADEMDAIDELFTLVDKGSRQALRDALKLTEKRR